MRKSHKRIFGALALCAGALGTTLLLRRRNSARPARASGDEFGRGAEDRWARPGMSVTFRAELMPGREPAARTFRVEGVLPSGRVTLAGFAGEHTESEFEHVR